MVCKSFKCTEGFSGSRIIVAVLCFVVGFSLLIMATPHWSVEQLQVLDLLEDAMKASRRERVAKLIRVEGPSSTGKSSLLMEMARRVRGHYGNPDAAAIVAYTNAASSAVQGATIHRLFSLPTDGEPGLLADRNKTRLAEVRVLLIDEANMVSPQMLNRMDMRLRTAVGENGTPFGGRVVVAFGDHRSWGPIPYKPGHRPSVSATWSAFTEVKLEKVHVQDQDHTFRDALHRLAADAVTDADVARFKARRLSELSAAEQRSFENSPRIFANNEAAESHNSRRRLQERASLPPSTVITSTKMAMDHYRQVDLWEGAPVLVTSTIPGVATAGSLGTVTALLLGGTKDVEAAKVRLDAEGSTEAEDVMVLKDADDAIPLAAAWHATSLPKALGMHFSRVVLDLPDGWGGAEFVYGAVSRARAWKGLAFEGTRVPRAKQIWLAPAAPWLFGLHYDYGWDDEEEFDFEEEEEEFDEELEEEEFDEEEEELEEDDEDQEDEDEESEQEDHQGES